MTYSPESNLLEKIQTKLALQRFEEYKQYIAQELVKNYSGSFMTVERLGNNWQETLSCNAEYVNALKHSTRNFLYIFPADDLNYCSPVFFETLIREICVYIAPYVCRLDKTKSEHEIKQILFKELFTSNKFVCRQIERYNKKHGYRIKQQKIAKQEANATPQKRIRKRIGEQIEISVIAEQISETDADKINQEIQNRRKKIKKERLKEKYKLQQQIKQTVLIQVSVISK